MCNVCREIYYQFWLTLLPAPTADFFLHCASMWSAQLPVHDGHHWCLKPLSISSPKGRRPRNSKEKHCPRTDLTQASYLRLEQHRRIIIDFIILPNRIMHKWTLLLLTGLAATYIRYTIMTFILWTISLIALFFIWFSVRDQIQRRQSVRLQVWNYNSSYSFSVTNLSCLPTASRQYPFILQKITPVELS